MCLRFCFLLLYVFFTLFFTGTSTVFCQADKADSKPLSISNIFLDKKTFSPVSDSSVTIHYTLSKDAFVTVRLYNESDVLIRKLIQGQKTAEGSHSVKWDGKNDAGDAMPSGVYIYTIEAEDDFGNKVIYDPADESGGLLLEPRKPFLDKEKGEISYVMPKAGMVCIRAGIKDGPLLHTVLDWEAREAGKNTEKWNGKDKSGLIDMFSIPNRDLYIFAYSLPNNSIILSDKESGQLSDSFPGSAWKRSPDGSAVPTEYRPRKETDPKTKYRHALHEKSICHEPRFQVIFPTGQEKTAEGIPILKGTVPVKIVISENDRHHLESERFEVMFFVDTVFLFEDEEGFTPFTYMWNTKDLAEGEHIFTVNILSYDDHCGVESRKIIIRR
jgi:hypothetical protein